MAAVIYVRCSDQEKKRIERAAEIAMRSVSKYVLFAVMIQVRSDEGNKK